MDKNALKEFFQRKYEGPQSFIENVIIPVFGIDNFDPQGYHYLRKNPKDQIAADNAGIIDIYVCGSIYIDGSQLDVFDITVSSKNQLANNRVGIQQLVRRIISTHSGAFMIFHYKTTDRWDWRFTFCHKGASQLDSTDSKRYTFLLGPGQSCRTAAENFCKLGNKIANDGEFEMNDIIKAFDVEALSKEFFDKYKAQYEKFVSYMADPANGMRNDFIDTDFEHSGLSDDEITSREEKPLRDYVKKLLGRIVFLHFIQKKGWLGVEEGKDWGEGDLDFMMNLFNKATESQQENFLDEILEPLFENALNTNRADNGDLFDTKVCGLSNHGVLKIPYLNGGLFEREASDEPDSRFPAEYFKSLLTFLSQYNFTIDENDPNDAQVGIDPEMLGRIFENLLEDNKDKGAFYTPKEVVQYMCRESLIAYLQANKTEEEKQSIRDFVSSYDVEVLPDNLRTEVDEKLKAVKICDPAIGSGAFPMGLLKEIFYCRGSIENFDEAAEIKKDIIQNNIYGVDIEKGAVDIARLRFWLSIIVDEKTPHCLPNMDFKIMQGNSLIEDFKGIDLSGLIDGTPGRKRKKSEEGMYTLMFDEKDVVENLQHLLNSYYKLTDHHKKVEARSEINYLIKTYIKKYSMDDPVISAEIDALPIPNDKFFLWHTYFADVFKGDNGKSGFDIVIGNPPYIQLQANGGYLGELYKNAGFETYARTGDIYCLFYEKGWDILKDHGHLCFITSNKWMRAGYGEKTRGYFANKTNPKLLIDFSGVKIFDTATVDTNVLLYEKAANEGHTVCAVTDKKDKSCITNLSDFVQQNFSCNEFLSNNSWIILSSIEAKIKRKIESVGKPLKDWDIRINYGIKTGCNEAFIVDSAARTKILDSCSDEDERNRTAEIIRPILRGRDIKKYGYDFADNFLVAFFPSRKYDIDDFPSLKQYLLHFSEQELRENGFNWIADNPETLMSYSKQKLEQSGEPIMIDGHTISFGKTQQKSRKLTSNKWFETQDSISYWDDFNKPKIIYPNMTKYLPFVYDDKGYYTNQKCFILTGKHVAYLTALFNSSLFKYCFRDAFPELLGGTRELSKIFFDKIPILEVTDKVDNEFRVLLDDIQGEYTVEKHIAIDKKIFSLYQLSEDEMNTIGFIEIR